MSIYDDLKNITKLRSASFTSIIDVTNLNFKILSKAALEFLGDITYDEDNNSISLSSGSFKTINIFDNITLNLDGITTFKIDSHGRAEGQEILTVVSEAKRRRFTDFNDWPDIGVPGEIIYTGVQNHRHEFGEDFIAYLDGRGWVSLTQFNTAIEGLNLLVERGSPFTYPTPDNGTGLLWIGELGLETNYDPIDTTVYFTDDSGHTFDILKNFVWKKDGNNAIFRPNGKAIIGNELAPGSLQYLDGNEAAGYILTSDGAGNAYWAPNVGAVASIANYAYWETRSYTANVTETISHNLGTSNVIVDLIDANTNEKVDGHIDNYSYNSLDVTLAEDNTAVKIVILSAGGADADVIQKFNVSDKAMLSLETLADGDLATNNTITSTPVDGSYTEVKVNGIEYEVGNGIKTAACYFSGDGGLSARGFASNHPNGAIQAGDELYWNGSIAGFELESGYRISLLYLI